MISVSEAQKIISEQVFELKTEEVLLELACGRVLAEEVQADRDYPPFNRSAMDGVALRAAETAKRDSFRVAGTIYAGDFNVKEYKEGEAVKIMTGAAVPAGFDAVVKVEDTQIKGSELRIQAGTVSVGQHIAFQGEDLQEGEVALSKGVKIRPSEIALLASLGKNTVRVFKSPKVVVIATGNEIKPVDEEVQRHQIRNSNGPVLTAFFRQQLVHEVDQYLVADEPQQLEAVLTAALDSDIMILSGGVSMGEADSVPATLQKLGVENIFHKVKLKPGKPLWFGRKPNGPVVFAMPGNPFSCQVTFKLFTEPFLRACLGQESWGPLYLRADFERKKMGPMEEYFPCRVVERDGESLLQSCPFNGSGDITAAALSHGIARQSADMATIKKGDLVAFYFWQTPG
jgi:molybdopterin molybdotransferase